jgi:hypothetical protein
MARDMMDMQRRVRSRANGQGVAMAERRAAAGGKVTNILNYLSPQVGKAIVIPR